MKHFLASLAVLMPLAAHADPIFPNSVVSNDIDFITLDDPSTFHCLQFDGRSRQEMPSKLRNELFAENVFTFTAQYSDGTAVPLWLDPGFGDQATAEAYAALAAHRIGQLPTLMRAELHHVVINTGDATAAAEEDGQFFMLYADNMRRRVDTHDLSETIFHESVHATLQNNWITTHDWQDAVAADPGVITEYATTNAGEDFAESALFAYTYLRNPERLPENVRSAVENTIPSRTNVFDNIIVQWAPHVYSAGPKTNCS